MGNKAMLDATLHVIGSRMLLSPPGAAFLQSEAKVECVREDELLSSEPNRRPGGGEQQRAKSDDATNRQKAVAILEVRTASRST